MPACEAAVQQWLPLLGGLFRRGDGVRLAGAWEACAGDVFWMELGQVRAVVTEVAQ